MFEIEDNGISWLDDFEVEVPDSYISDSDKAMELVSIIIGHEIKGTYKKEHEIKRHIESIFDLFSEDNLANEVGYYSEFMKLFDRLSERQKAKEIGSKTVVGVGGKFSAGKSKFINTVAGLNGILPEDTSPTTSIPTYILKSKNKYIFANGKNGNTYSLDENKLSAMTHEFFNEYHIGFSSFVESIVMGCETSRLDNNIVLLDTPGYNKYDNKMKNTISDYRKARDQLRAVDFLIWLADVDNGVITQSDIDFIKSLNILTPMLIVFNKCDKITQKKISEILDNSVEVIMRAGIKCYGIAAYSAAADEEYDSRPLMKNEKKKVSGGVVNDYLKYTAKSGMHSNDISGQFLDLEKRFNDELQRYIDNSKKIIEETEANIVASENITNIQSLARIWSIESQRVRSAIQKKGKTKRLIDKLNTLIKDYIEGEEE